MTVAITTYDPETGMRAFDSLEEFSADQNPQEVVWIDIESEDTTELEAVAEILSLHELTVEDCLTPGHFPKLEDYGSYVFMVFRALKSWPEMHEYWESEDEEIDDVAEKFEGFTRKLAIYLSDKFVVTFRRRELTWMDAIVRQVRQHPEGFLDESTDRLTHKIIDVLTDRVTRGLSFFEKIIDKIEHAAVSSPDEFEIGDVVEMKSGLTSLKQIMRAQRGVVVRLANESSFIREAQQRRYFKDIDDHAVDNIHTIDKQVDMLMGLRDVYFTMANVRLGDTMRILAVITTVAAPLNIVVGLYGMNIEGIPLLHNPYGFWLIIITMIVLTALMLAYFRKNRWI